MSDIIKIIDFLEQLNVFMNKYEYDKFMIKEHDCIFDDLKIEEYFATATLREDKLREDWEILLDKANDINIFDFLTDNYVFYSDAKQNIINSIMIYHSSRYQAKDFKFDNGMFENHTICLKDKKLYLKYFNVSKNLMDMDIYLLRLLRNNLLYDID